MSAMYVVHLDAWAGGAKLQPIGLFDFSILEQYYSQLLIIELWIWY
jgi:hypothetical protein